MTRLICDLCCRHNEKRQVRIYDIYETTNHVHTLTPEQVSILKRMHLDAYCKFFVLQGDGLDLDYYNLDFLNEKEEQYVQEHFRGT